MKKAALEEATKGATQEKAAATDKPEAKLESPVETSTATEKSEDHIEEKKLNVANGKFLEVVEEPEIEIKKIEKELIEIDEQEQELLQLHEELKGKEDVIKATEDHSKTHKEESAKDYQGQVKDIQYSSPRKKEVVGDRTEAHGGRKHSEEP